MTDKWGWSSQDAHTGAIKVMNEHGRIVQSIPLENLEKGDHKVEWDLLTKEIKDGDPVYASSGVYYLQVEVVHKGMTLGSKLKPAVLPIYIFTPIAPIELHKQVKPLVWNPKVFQLTQFIVPEQQFASQYQKYMNLPG